MEERKKHEIHWVNREDANFPERLKKLTGMPKKLYYIGNLPDPAKPSAAVVGARMSSPYGRCQAFKYARTMAEHGVQIISGMARGIDSEGHKGALDTDTPTFAVLGSGVDVCYPESNRRLYERILEKALSDAVLVVEAKEQSGSLITANFALEHGHSVYAVPGAVTDELSRGCNKLIFDGAGIAYTPEIMLMEWGIQVENPPANIQKKKLGLAPDLDLVYSGLDLRPENMDHIIRKTGFSAAKVCTILTELQLMGLVQETGRKYCRVPEN